MKFIREFFVAAKRDSQLYLTLSYKTMQGVVFYIILTGVVYFYTGDKYLGGDNMKGFLMVFSPMLFIFSILNSMYYIVSKLRRLKNDSQKTEHGE